MLLSCEGLRDSREAVLDLWRRKLEPVPEIQALSKIYKTNEDNKHVQFLLDPSTLPEVIKLTQLRNLDAVNLIFYLTRTFCASLHKAKMKMLGII